MFEAALFCCLLFLVVYGIATRTKNLLRPFSPDQFTIVAAFVAMVAIVLAFVVPLEQRPSTQIAWTGVQTEHEDGQILLGDTGGTSVLGWPNGSFAPAMTLNCTSDTSCRVETKGGGAFLVQNGHYLNGDLVQLDQSVALGKFQVVLRHGLFEQWGVKFELPFGSARRLSIRGANGEELATTVNFKEQPGRAKSIQILLEEKLGELRMRSWRDKDSNSAQLASDLEEWGLPLRLILDEDGCHILTDANYGAPVLIGPDVNVLWPGRRLVFSIERVAAVTSIVFHAPWQRWSVIPTPEGTPIGDVSLTVTAHPKAGDYALLMPLAGKQPVSRKATMHNGLFVPVRDGAMSDGMRRRVNPAAAKLEVEGATSKFAMNIESESAILSTVRTSPRLGWMGAGVFLAWLVFSFSLLQTMGLMETQKNGMARGLGPADRWLVCALVFTVWLFLLLRLGLAMRYAQDPAFIDSVVVTGVVWAMAALALIPTVLLKTAVNWLPYTQGTLWKRDRSRILRITGISCGAVLAEIVIAQEGIFPVLSTSAPPVQGISGWCKVIAFLSILIAWTLLRVSMNYGPTSDNASANAGETHWTSRVVGVVHASVKRMPRWLRDYAYQDERSIWRAVKSNDGRFWRQFWQTSAIVLIAAFIFALIYWTMKQFLPGSEPLKEIVAPVVLCLPAAVLLLNSRRVFRSGQTIEKFDWVKASALTVVLVVLLVIVYPLLMKDPGALIVTLSIYIPVSILLLVGLRPFRLGLMNLTLLMAGGVFMFMVIMQYPPAMNTAKQLGQVEVRVLTFRDDDVMRKVLLYSAVGKQDDISNQPISATTAGQSQQHGWETRAISRVGGIHGLGFGEAPTRNSHVRQDTLQFDSTFSFFVLSEHGILGGVCLLLLYSVPLLLVLHSSRRRMSVGQGLAVAIACSFFLEAVIHALMNVGALPMTGRSLPLLSVKSFSDLARWTIFFQVVVQASLWRLSGDAKKFIRSDSSILTSSTGSLSNPEPIQRWGITVAIFASLVVGLTGWVAYTDYKILADETGKYDEFSWATLLDGVREFAETKNSSGSHNLIWLNNGRIELDPELQRNGTSVIEQEIARFNVLPDAQKIQGMAAQGAAEYCRDSRGVNTLQKYDALIGRLREADRISRIQVRPVLFELVPIEEEAFTEPQESASGDPCRMSDTRYKIVPNPSYNSKTSFRQPHRRNEIMTVTLAGNRDKVEVGPAWVDGTWRSAPGEEQVLPSLDGLVSAMEINSNPSHSESGTTNPHIQLTLDQELQKDLQEFLALHGRERHAELLERRITTPADMEPPRVAITVLDLKTGEVLGLGGWPHANPGNTWASERFEDPKLGEHFIPSQRWLEDSAPASLRRRYAGERNFEPQLMGSSTKPLWAAAVLSLHPSLDQRFGVRGGNGTENQVFGMTIPGRGWGVEALSGLKPGDKWCNLDCFLTRSDNRFETRFGFLGLAEDDNSDGVAEGKSRQVKTTEESMDFSRENAFWTHYPKFPGALDFGPGHSQHLENLDESSLAVAMNDFYGVASTGKSASVLRSVWTGNENDDISLVSNTDRLRWISPHAPDFGFGETISSRDFVNLLLGGGNNQWPNIDFAGAFASVVVGKPVVPHLIRIDGNAISTRRPIGSVIAKKLRPGLAGVVTNHLGTAYKHNLDKSSGYQSAFKGMSVYAKTGTLNSSEFLPDTSRIALVAVRWKPGDTEVQNGLVFSVMIDRGKEGMATEWLGHFLDKYGATVKRLAEDNDGEGRLRSK